MEQSLEKILEQYEPYCKEKKNWVGSRDYWKLILEDELNKDPLLHKKFSDFHEHIVNEIIQFCKENRLDDADAVDIHVDGIYGSISFGEWTSSTDSSMSVRKTYIDEHGWNITEKEPFLFEC